jgi:antitoxin component of MazEF toxin-antitoxin module
MKPIELKVARIGNSRGIRIPACTLARYGIAERVTMEERTDGILIRPRKGVAAKLSWEETAQAMAAAREDWMDWEPTLGDGLAAEEWLPPPRRVSQPKPSGPPRRRR